MRGNDFMAYANAQDKLPCEMCESSTGNFCLVCGFEEGDECPYDIKDALIEQINRDLEAAKATARVWDQVLKVLFEDK